MVVFGIIIIRISKDKAVMCLNNSLYRTYIQDSSNLLLRWDVTSSLSAA